MIHSIGIRKPVIHPSAFLAWNAEIAGDVTVKENASIWFSATIRGDTESITIGKGSNVQDNAVLHADPGHPCRIGNLVTIGHGAIVHSCTVEDNCTIGMGAIILTDAHISEGCLVAAGALVAEKKDFPPHSLIVGSPARAIRTLTEEDVAAMKKNALHYSELAGSTDYRRGMINESGGIC